MQLLSRLLPVRAARAGRWHWMQLLSRFLPVRAAWTGRWHWLCWGESSGSLKVVACQGRLGSVQMDETCWIDRNVLHACF
jgi:hypothetical protein